MPAVAEIVCRVWVRQRAGTRPAPTVRRLEGKGQAQGLPLPAADWSAKGRHKACPYLRSRGRRWLRCYLRYRNVYPNSGPRPLFFLRLTR